eukprot:GHUV01005716.1.p1 GENE.GHUV01005716.1~~GHUV01005716.1.p1  ORF type:complete len:291 (+),score=136.94 GHUV01005716.1:24-875(+)
MAGTAAATEQQQQQQQQHPEQAQQQQGASMPEAAAANQQVQQRPAKRHKSSGAEQRQQQQLPAVDLTVFRGKDVLGLTVQLGQEDSLGTDRLVHWCGAQLQATHRAVRELGFQPEGAGVFISRWHHGSPAHRYGLFALHWILEVNGQATPDLDSFLQVVDPLRDGDFARLKVCHLETTQTKVLTLKLDTKYWPSWELRRDPQTGTWNRHMIHSSGGSSGQPGLILTAAAGSAAAAAAGSAAGGAAGAHLGTSVQADGTEPSAVAGAAVADGTEGTAAAPATES